MKINIVRNKRRKHIAFSVEAGGIINVRAPYGISEKQIKEILHKHEEWILKQLQIEEEKAKERSCLPKLSGAEREALGKEAARLIPQRVRYYATMLDVEYGRITIRCQKTRWGSCSARGNLNFNCLLMLAPPEVLDYVVVHELCHRKEMNHSKAFWAEVEKILPDYRKAKGWLTEHGGELMARWHA